MTLDELVKDIDVQDVREKNMIDERVASIYLDVENGKATFKKIVKIVGYIILAVVAAVLIGFLGHMAFHNAGNTGSQHIHACFNY